MSGGEQQMLAIARGMMGLPKLLMVDEPFFLKDLIPSIILIIYFNLTVQNVRLL